MSDKPLVQQALASELSALILSIEPVSCESLEDRTLVALDFVAGFWECLVREWAGIDRLRCAAVLDPAELRTLPASGADAVPSAPLLTQAR